MLLSAYAIHTTPSEIWVPLAIEHAHFSTIDAHREGALLFWEASRYFVVLGHGNRLRAEVNERNCQQDNIPIFRRISGGGAVLQGPGCLNFAYIVPIDFDERLEGISSTTHYFLDATQQILSRCGIRCDIQGTSDLTINGVKFSGNAQKRSRSAVLFHGTILYNFDIPQLARYLNFPTKSPDYRLNRSHADFVRNIAISPEQFISESRAYWKTAELQHLPNPAVITQIGQSHYANDNWNSKF